MESIYVPIQIGNTQTQWSSGVAVSLDEINLPVQQMTQILIIIIAAMIVLVTAGMIIIVSRSITRPVKATADFAKALASGKLDKKITIKSKDEIGQLTGILDNEVRTAFKNIESARAVAKKTGRVPVCGSGEAGRQSGKALPRRYELQSGDSFAG